MGSEQIRFLQPQQAHTPRRKRWGGCFGGLSCFNKQNCGKRIVPASRIPEANAFANLPNGPQAGILPNQANGSLYAPPSSPASFSQSPLPSTAQSPNNCFLSANSPERPSSIMFVTGPYANETQLVSPPVFSTFTTEPSTAPLTPPPELAHLTTPSSPDVPYARFLSSSSIPPQWDPSIPTEGSTYANSGYIEIQKAGASKSRQDSNFFCPETFAQFYLDQSALSNTGGRLSISRESDAYNSNGGNGHQNRQSKTCKPDAEELEAYRASFGFSADDIISTAHYVEITDVMEDSFGMTPFSSNKPVEEEDILSLPEKGAENEKRREDYSIPQLKMAGLDNADVGHSGVSDMVPQKRLGDASGRSFTINHAPSDDEGIYSITRASRNGRKYHFGSSNSDAEIDYGRGQSLREGRSKCDI